MKFRTCSIHQEEQKGKAQMQVTFDEDYNLPDYKPDVSGIITTKGTVVADDVRVSKGRVSVKGTVRFDVLYQAEQNSLGFCSLSGTVGFQETLMVDEAEEFDTASVSCVLEDLSIHITNSRKLSIRGLLQLQVTILEFPTIELPCECMEEQDLEIQRQRVEYLDLAAWGKDQCRVHEELELPANKLNVQSVVWKDIRLESVSCNCVQGNIQIKGELTVFCLYQGEPGIRLEWYENRIPILCHMPVDQAEAEEICYAKTTDADWNFQVQEDLEGENRVFVIDGAIKCEYRMYRESSRDIIRDLYSLKKKVAPVCHPVCLEKLLMKNDCRCKLNDLLQIPLGQKEILQILSCGGDIQVDHQEVVKNGIQVEGVVKVRVLYLTQDDAIPVEAAEGMLPFQYCIDAPGIEMGCRYELSPEISMLSVMMKNSSLLEIQALLDFHVIVFSPVRVDVFSEVKEEPLKMEELLELPGMTGIRVKEGDSLWSIAKRNHTTCETIRQNNPALEEPLKPGSVLLLLKEIL